MSNTSKSDTTKRIREIFNEEGLQGKALKEALRELVRESWPDLPPWSTLDAPQITEVQTATVGSGIALLFREKGVWKAVMAETGAHYAKNAPDAAPSYMIAGGFINLTDTPGSSLVAPVKGRAEDPRTGGARELEEEFKKPGGDPLLAVDPSRMKPMDTLTLTFGSGEKRIVIGFMLEMNPDEIRTVKEHVARLETDPAYKAATAAETINPASGLAEVGSVKIFDLADIANGNCNLLHKDQQSLFKVIQAALAEPTVTKAPKPRT